MHAPDPCLVAVPDRDVQARVLPCQSQQHELLALVPPSLAVLDRAPVQLHELDEARLLELPRQELRLEQCDDPLLWQE